MAINKKQISLTDEEILTIKAMIEYMLTGEDVNKVDDKFVDKLFNLEEKFSKLAC
jgi:hypothetical protein